MGLACVPEGRRPENHRGVDIYLIAVLDNQVGKDVLNVFRFQGEDFVWNDAQ